MRRRVPWRSDPESPRLFRREEEGHVSSWTEALADPPDVYGERIVSTGEHVLRRWEPSRSKLAAAFAKGFDGPLPRLRDRWLYLGAATGTTASHVADLVGTDGAVFAVERSLRPFARLLRLAERYPNLLPILGDARRPESYAGDVGPVEGVYVDVAQPDQVDIALSNARRFLGTEGTVLLVLKTASMGRERDARGHLADTLERLDPILELQEPIPLEPFHRRHFLLAGQPNRRMFRPGSEAAPASSLRPGPRAARRR